MFVGNFNRYIKGHIIDILSCPLKISLYITYKHIFIKFLSIFYTFLLNKIIKKKFNKNTKKYCKILNQYKFFIHVQMFDISLV